MFVTIHWNWDQSEKKWWGFVGDKSVRYDDPDYVVFEVEPNHWAGWKYFEDGGRGCVTWDYDYDDGAKRECELFANGYNPLEAF